MFFVRGMQADIVCSMRSNELVSECITRCTYTVTVYYNIRTNCLDVVNHNIIFNANVGIITLIVRPRQNIVIRLTKKARHVMLYEQLRWTRKYQFLTLITDKRLLRYLVEVEMFRLTNLVSV